MEGKNCKQFENSNVRNLFNSLDFRVKKSFYVLFSETVTCLFVTLQLDSEVQSQQYIDKNHCSLNCSRLKLYYNIFNRRWLEPSIAFLRKFPVSDFLGTVKLVRKVSTISKVEKMLLFKRLNVLILIHRFNIE